MSFILDAIKKSETERQKNREPDVHSLQAAGGYKTERSRQLRRFASFIVSVCLIAGIGIWLWPKIEDQFAIQKNPAQVNAESDYSRGISELTHNREERNVSDNRVVASALPERSSDNPTVIKEEQHQTTAVLPITDADAELPPRHLIREFWELPADYQSTVPDMEYSFHVFSKEPARRTIIINGRTIKEGQMVASGLKLRVITETGVIFHYRDRFFHVDVVEKW